MIIEIKNSYNLLQFTKKSQNKNNKATESKTKIQQMLDRLVFANSIARSKHSLNINKVQKRNLVS